MQYTIPSEILVQIRKHSSNITNVNFEMHTRNATFLAQQKISETLGTEVEYEMVNSIRGKPSRKLERFVKEIELVGSLCKAFVTKNEFSLREVLSIQISATVRILRMCWKRFMLISSLMGNI